MVGVMSGRPVDLETVLELCGDRHRRIALAVLDSRRRPISVSDLAASVGRHDCHASSSDEDTVTAARVQCALAHVHLPMLAALDLVEYDAGRRMVEPTDGFDRLQPHLSVVLETDPGFDGPLER